METTRITVVVCDNKPFKPNRYRHNNHSKFPSNNKSIKCKGPNGEVEEEKNQQQKHEKYIKDEQIQGAKRLVDDNIVI